MRFIVIVALETIDKVRIQILKISNFMYILQGNPIVDELILGHFAQI